MDRGAINRGMLGNGQLTINREMLGDGQLN